MMGHADLGSGELSQEIGGRGDYEAEFGKHDGQTVEDEGRVVEDRLQRGRRSFDERGTKRRVEARYRSNVANLRVPGVGFLPAADPPQSSGRGQSSEAASAAPGVLADVA